MFIKSKDMKSSVRDRLRGGMGSIDFYHIVDKEYLPAKSRLFSIMTLDKDCSIGKHEHEKESEIYYCLEGEGIVDDNGAIRPIRPGDCNVCASGDYHSIKNVEDKPLILLAVIILD